MKPKHLFAKVLKNEIEIVKLEAFTLVITSIANNKRPFRL